jgi:ATP-binding cassette subfamily B protein
MDTAPKKNYKAGPVIKAYTEATRHYPWLFFGVLIGALLIEAAGIIAPLYLSRFITLLAAKDVTAEVAHASLGLLAIVGVVYFIGWIGQRVRYRTISLLEIRVMSDLANQAFDYLIRHSHNFFISNFAGTLTRRVNRYSRSFEQVFDALVMNFFSTFVFAAGVIITLGIRNVWLGLALLVWSLFFIWLQLVMTKWRQSFRIKKAEEDSKVTGLLSDAVANHSTVTLFATAAAEERIFRNANEDLNKATLRSWFSDDLVFGVQGLFAIVIEIALLAGGVFLWSDGIIGVGDFVLIQVYMIGLIERIWGVGANMRRLYDAFADANEMVDILSTPHAIMDRPQAKDLANVTGAIDFKKVEFSFGKTASVLTEFSLHIPSGQKLALVGPSGAGKTTVTKLLLRLYDVTSGSISIDGTDIREATQESVRRVISFVPQEPILFHRSLRDNIRYGNPDASDEEVIEAAKKAHCHEFISKLEQGYDTFVGERGVKLSGGERQRVAIARAILKNAPILVLDEATSSLDSESEHLIQDALKHLMKGKTVIVIAHRLSTIMEMDRIIVMQDGAIVADGTHKELLAQGELYHKLWSIQAGGFILDEE